MFVYGCMCECVCERPQACTHNCSVVTLGTRMWLSLLQWLDPDERLLQETKYEIEVCGGESTLPAVPESPCPGV